MESTALEPTSTSNLTVDAYNAIANLTGCVHGDGPQSSETLACLRERRGRLSTHRRRRFPPTPKFGVDLKGNVSETSCHHRLDERRRDVVHQHVCQDSPRDARFRTSLLARFERAIHLHRPLFIPILCVLS